MKRPLLTLAVVCAAAWTVGQFFWRPTLEDTIWVVGFIALVIGYELEKTQGLLDDKLERIADKLERLDGKLDSILEREANFFRAELDAIERELGEE